LPSLFEDSYKNATGINAMLRRIIVGRGPEQSPKVYKQSVLRGSLAMIMASTGLAYILIDLSFSITRTFPLYSSLIVAGLASFWLNRNRRYRLSTLMILITGNAIVYLLAASEPPSSGVFVFFIPIALAAMALFSYAEWYWALGTMLFGFALFLAAYLIDFSVLPVGTYSTEYDRVNFIINFTVAGPVSVLIVYFLITLNYEAEKKLEENETRLIAIAEELRHSRERFALAIQGTRAGIYEWRTKENSVFLSPIWKEMLGYGSGEDIDMSAERLIQMTHPDDRKKTHRSITNHLATGEPYHNELRLQTKSGEYKWFYDSGVSKRNAAGETETIVGSIIDINERKKAEQQILEQNELLAKANAELDRFVYSVSHDLRAPLSSVRGLITIAEKSDDIQELKSYLGMMHDRVNALEKFIRDIIDYSRNSRLEVIREPVVLNELIHEIRESLRFTDEMNSVSINSQIPEDFAIISDKVRLKIVLNNLLSNALKYHDHGKPHSFVSIYAAADNGQIKITMEDNGIGIDHRLLPNIFKMFYRASENSRGSGLGLYIARETAAKLGGSITAESELGKGTRFHLWLPAS
jgi:PAS domain S-box-containing protein